MKLSEEVVFRICDSSMFWFSKQNEMKFGGELPRKKIHFTALENFRKCYENSNEMCYHAFIDGNRKHFVNEFSPDQVKFEFKKEK